MLVTTVCTIALVSAATNLVQTPNASPQIITTGTGTVRLPPDRALVSIAIETRGPTAGRAAAAGALPLARVRDSLQSQGFHAESIQTISFGVAPRYDYPRGGQLIDYAARTVLAVRLRDLDRLGGMLDGVLGAGATSIASIEFESDTLARARDGAFSEALAAARSEAAALAKAAGGGLGPLILVSTTPTSSFSRGASYSGSGYEGSIAPNVRRDVIVSVWLEARWAFVAP